MTSPSTTSVSKLDQLTICSVSFNSKSCLGLNWSIAARLNATEELRWLVVENSCADSAERLSLDDRRFVVVEGRPPGKTGSPFPQFHVENYNHAASLNQALRLIDTRYALFLDPDFFIVRPGWIGDVLDHMETQKLSFLGAPYYPDRRRKYRYFPCVWCLFVDLNRVRKTDLDFTPDYDEQLAAASLHWTDQIDFGFFGRRLPKATLPADATPQMVRSAFFIYLVNRLLPRFRGPAEVMCSHDVGHRIYHSFYRKSAHSSECLIPSWKNPLYSQPPSLEGHVARGRHALDHPRETVRLSQAEGLLYRYLLPGLWASGSGIHGVAGVHMAW